MKHVHTVVLGAAALLFVAIQACSSEEAAVPSRPPIPPPSGEAGVDGGNNPDGGDGGSSGNCFDATKTKPTTPDHFLNQCSSGECFKFENATRIEGFTPGPLPPLN